MRSHLFSYALLLLSPSFAVAQATDHTTSQRIDGLPSTQASKSSISPTPESRKAKQPRDIVSSTSSSNSPTMPAELTACVSALGTSAEADINECYRRVVEIENQCHDGTISHHDRIVRHAKVWAGLAGKWGAPVAFKCLGWILGRSLGGPRLAYILAEIGEQIGLEYGEELGEQMVESIDFAVTFAASQMQAAEGWVRVQLSTGYDTACSCSRSTYEAVSFYWPYSQAATE